MLSTVMRALKGSIALIGLAVSTLFFVGFICLGALGKFLAPEGPARDWFRKRLAGVAEAWIGVNNWGLSLYATHWDVELPAGMDRKGCYLVNSNHQSWVDIPVLQRCFNRRLPLQRFFIKSQLVWVPLLGIAWWALDFPFMKRFSREEIERRPELKGKDLESARAACEKFRHIPVAMMNFPEGTRFSPAKRSASGSPYRHLLQPRTGGNGQVLYALGDELDALVDVTIVYPGQQSAPTLWQLVSGQVPEIRVRATLRDIPADLRGVNFRENPEMRQLLQDWFNELWVEKDELISVLS